VLYDNEGHLVLTRATTASGTTSPINFGLTETVLTSTSTTTTNYYVVAGQRVAEQVGSTFSYLIANLEGSPTVALDSTGHVSAVQLFLPSGAQGFTWGTMPTAHSSTDQLLDSQMGLLYYGARFYDPLSAQFTSADVVLNNAEGWNPYAYVAGNPETFVDPTGHFMEGSGGAVFFMYQGCPFDFFSPLPIDTRL
jgi:RHS repeat-associated protein